MIHGLEEGFQGGENHRSDVITDPYKFGGYGFKVYPGYAFVERYLHGGIDIHVHLNAWIDRFGGEACDWCVLFHDSTVRLNNAGADHGITHGSGVQQETPRHYGDWVQEPMLAHSVEFVQDEEGILREARPALVRLHPLNRCTCYREHATYPTYSLIAEKSRADTGSSVLVNVPKNGEGRCSGNIIRQRHSAGTSQFVGEQVESRSKIMQAVGDQHGEGTHWQWVRRGGKQEIARSLRVQLLSDAVVVTINPLLDRTIQLLQVLLSSVDSY